MIIFIINNNYNSAYYISERQIYDCMNNNAINSNKPITVRMHGYECLLTE